MAQTNINTWLSFSMNVDEDCCRWRINVCICARTVHSICMCILSLLHWLKMQWIDRLQWVNHRNVFKIAFLSFVRSKWFVINRQHRYTYMRKEALEDRIDYLTLTGVLANIHLNISAFIYFAKVFLSRKRVHCILYLSYTMCGCTIWIVICIYNLMRLSCTRTPFNYATNDERRKQKQKTHTKIEEIDKYTTKKKWKKKEKEWCFKKENSFSCMHNVRVSLVKMCRHIQFCISLRFQWKPIQLAACFVDGAVAVAYFTRAYVTISFLFIWNIYLR